MKKLLSLPGVAVLAAFVGLALAVPTTAAVAQASTVVNGVNLGPPTNNPHRWGDCWVQDFKNAPGYGWVIVSTGYWDPSGFHATSPQIVRNGMLWGWFDRGGAPGLGCPTNWQHNPGVHDSRVVAQDFTRGTLLWVPGMDHAVQVDKSRWPAVKWGLQYLGSTQFDDMCLLYVTEAYNYGLYGGKIVLHGGPYDQPGKPALAYQWWYPGTHSVGVRDGNAPFGSFAVWAGPEAHDGSGHIALGLGGGYILTTKFYGATVHVMKLPVDTQYLGWEWPK